MKNYKWYDMQEETNFYTGSLYSAKLWLIDFWQWTDIHKGEILFSPVRFERFILDIQKADINELFEMLSGIDWTIQEEGGEQC